VLFQRQIDNERAAISNTILTQRRASFRAVLDQGGDWTRMSTLGSAVLSSVARQAATFVDHPLDEFFQSAHAQAMLAQTSRGGQALSGSIGP
jgi:hypothetical protein